MNPQKLYEDEISNDVNAQQMIYFGKEKAFNEWLDLHKRLEEKIICRRILIQDI